MTTAVELPGAPGDVTQADGTQAASPRRGWTGFAVVLAAMIMNILDSTIMNVAAPSIQRDLGMSSAALEWIAAAYTLAIAVGLMTGGRLGDKFGRQRMVRIRLTGGLVARLADRRAGGAGPVGRDANPTGVRADPRPVPAREDDQGVRRARPGDRAVDRGRADRGRAAAQGQPVRQ